MFQRLLYYYTRGIQDRLDLNLSREQSSNTSRFLLGKLHKVGRNVLPRLLYFSLPSYSPSNLPQRAVITDTSDTNRMTSRNRWLLGNILSKNTHVRSDLPSSRVCSVCSMARRVLFWVHVHWITPAQSVSIQLHPSPSDLARHRRTFLSISRLPGLIVNTRKPVGFLRFLNYLSALWSVTTTKS